MHAGVAAARDNPARTLLPCRGVERTHTHTSYMEHTSPVWPRPIEIFGWRRWVTRQVGVYAAREAVPRADVIPPRAAPVRCRRRTTSRLRLILQCIQMQGPPDTPTGRTNRLAWWLAQRSIDVIMASISLEVQNGLTVYLTHAVHSPSRRPLAGH